MAERQIVMLGRDGPLAEFYLDRASHEAGAAAEIAASRKENKYSNVDNNRRYNADQFGSYEVKCFASERVNHVASFEQSIGALRAFATSYPT